MFNQTVVAVGTSPFANWEASPGASHNAPFPKDAELTTTLVYQAQLILCVFDLGFQEAHIGASLLVDKNGIIWFVQKVALQAA